MSKSDIEVIPQLRQVFYLALGDFPVTGLRIGALAYATDTLLLYRWNGVLWQAITSYGKEIIVPATGGTNLTDVNYNQIPLLIANDKANVRFLVPVDFTSIIDAVLIIVANVTNAAANLDITSYYAGIGEPFNTHSENDAASTYAINNTWYHEIDVSGILSAIAVGDHVVLRLLLGDALHDVSLCGMRFRYA